MAVADVFDALTSKRCDKDAMPLEKAYAIILEETGTHFDPAAEELGFSDRILLFVGLMQNIYANISFAVCKTGRDMVK